MILGYADRLSLRPGETIQFHISADVQPYRSSVVRLHGVCHIDGPDGHVREETVASSLDGMHDGRPQRVQTGSYMQAAIHRRTAAGLTFGTWVKPTLVSASPQAIALIQGSAAADRLCLHVQNGILCWEAGSADRASGSGTGPVVSADAWNYVAISLDPDAGSVTLLRITLNRDGGVEEEQVQHTIAGMPMPTIDHIIVAADRLHDPEFPDDLRMRWHFNGRAEAPVLLDGPCTTSAIRQLALEGTAAVSSAKLFAAWDFSTDMSTPTAHDTGPHSRHGRFVNRPTRAVRGRAWDGPTDWTRAPHLWAAVHFHEDDLDDAGWSPSLQLQIPDVWPSGIYALRIEQSGQVDHVPFYVRAGGRKARVLFLAPTNTYLAYANEHLSEGVRGEALSRVMREPIVISPADHYLFAHPELGRSLYDCHRDGSGVVHSSCLRPILNMRPNYRTWINYGRRHFAADFYITGWLEHLGIEFDVVTDADLDREGADLLKGYRVVVTGSHPEYPTLAELDALEAYGRDGGHLMYLGANGFYWVTAFTDARRSTIEVRRGYAGQRNWTSHGAEVILSSTGEPGGLWLHRGRAPQRLVGVGSIAAGFGGAAGYARAPAASDPRFAWMFAGVEEEIVGAYGWVMGGAAGDELDRTDAILAEGATVTTLMTSAGRHNEYDWPFVETQMDITPRLGGHENPGIRSDVVLVERPNGGMVFSAGSICWAGSLAWNEFENGISRLTSNVLFRFLNDPGE